MCRKYSKWYNKSLPRVLENGKAENWVMITFEKRLSDNFP